MVNPPPCTCISCLIASKMPLRHRLSSLGVAPRLDARPCLKKTELQLLASYQPLQLCDSLLLARFAPNAFPARSLTDAIKMRWTKSFITTFHGNKRCPAQTTQRILVLVMAWN